eukprot:m.452087 g.452087  ORF g.452087 m.452087 type:complete len:372 (-) comp20265_c0_seq1:270-1385(-)
MVMRPPCGRIKTGTVLGCIAFGFLLIATDWVLGRYAHGQTLALRKEEAEVRAKLRALQEETKQFKARRNDMDLSVKEMSAQMKRLKATATPPMTTAVPTRSGNSVSFPKNRVINDPPFCKVGAKRRGDLPKFVFVAGVEGSGHHALKGVWQSLRKSGLKLELVVYDQLFHSLGIENHASYHYSSILQNTHIEHMRPVFEKAAAEGKIVIDAQNSYPMGKGAGALAHPDLLKLAALDGVLYDLHVIVLFRTPVDAVLSAVRRFQNNDEYLYKNEEYQARMVTESLATINNALPQLPCGKTMVIEYNTLVHSPKQFIRPLSRLLEVEQDVLGDTFSDLKPRTKPPETPEQIARRKKLQDFFGIQKVLWPLLES